MKVEEFIKGYKSSTNKTAFVKKHIIHTYVPYIQKINNCREIINKTLYIKNGEHEIYKSDTATRYLLFSISIIMLYTDIEMSTNKRIEEFDLLEEQDIFTVLGENIGKDYLAYSTILQGMIEDEKENNGLLPFLKKELINFDSFLNSINVGSNNVTS